jgi:hypothetical protein
MPARSSAISAFLLVDLGRQTNDFARPRCKLLRLDCLPSLARQRFLFLGGFAPIRRDWIRIVRE